MKRNLLLFIFILGGLNSQAQNINDNKFNFQYTQLPLIKIDDRFTNYEVRIEHGYEIANEDSTNQFNARKQAQQSSYEMMLTRYQFVRDSLDRDYLRQLSTWEISTNNGVMGPNNTPLAKPNPPIYPEPPYLMPIQEPFLHSQLDENAAKQQFNVEGFKQGMGGFIITVTVHPIQFMPVQSEKKGSGASTKYTYRLPYILPLSVKIESPTQGTLLEENLFQQMSYFNLPDQKSMYDHELYMMDSKATVYRQVETSARAQVVSQLNNYLNDQIGYPVKTRYIELYSVKKYKDYEYSDVTNAYTEAMQALSLIKNSKDWSAARTKIDKALASIEKILQESDINDGKARINDKVTAVLQCNKVELLIWKAAFDAADMEMNLILNSGEGKAKRHIQGQQGFYADLKKRYKANY
ncbi:MAG: hypothetical protein EP333_01370 [Bacteroidetes bacterium]|nr:MAG: hypothetical protein EP333_01370 [Bacteroidota bacterium]